LDYQVAFPLGLTEDGIWQEVKGGIHGHWPEDVFAEKVHELAMSLPGAVVVVERNVGSAVLVKLRELGTPNVYRHRHRDQTGKQYMQLGFPMTSATKRVAISDTQRMLRDGELALVDEVLKAELSEYEWKVREVVRGMEQVTNIAGAPDRAGAHDDKVSGLLLAVQGIVRAEARLDSPVQMRV
jgi:hypothetical protein